MLSSKIIFGLAIVSSLPLVLWQSSANASRPAGTPLFLQTPNLLLKAERSVARGQSDHVIQLLGGRVDELQRRYLRSSGYGFLCQAHYQKQDYVSAEKSCDKAVTIGRPGWSTLNNRGVMRFKLERYEEALADFEKAASIMMRTSSVSQRRSVRHNISAAGERIDS